MGLAVSIILRMWFVVSIFPKTLNEKLRRKEKDLCIGNYHFVKVRHDLWLGLSGELGPCVRRIFVKVVL